MQATNSYWFLKFYDYIIFNYNLINEVILFYLEQLLCLYIPFTHILVLGHLLG